MVGNLYQLYKNYFKPRLVPHGFLLHKKTFYRVRNDVLQTLIMRNMGQIYSIEFSITPLCIGISDLYTGCYDVSMLRKNGKGGWDSTQEPFESIVQEMWMVVAEYVVPVFEKGVDVISADKELLQYQIAHYAPIMHKRTPIEQWALLKAKNYKRAFELLAIDLSHRISWLEKCLTTPIEDTKATAKDYEQYLAKYENELAELRKMDYCLSVSDIVGIERIISETEAKSLEFLDTVCHQKQKP